MEEVKLIPHTAGFEKRINNPKYDGLNPDEDCSICGRPLAKERKDSSEGQWIYKARGGDHMAKVGTEDVEEAGFMGLYAIGPTCAKKFAKELAGYIYKG